MKQKLFTLFFLISCAHSFAQNAADYFPANLGYRWYFKTVMLDTLNNAVDSISTFSVDSLALSADYKGLSAKYIKSKSGLQSTVLNQPYTDTSFVNLNSTTGSVYFSTSMINAFLQNGDTTRIDSLFQGFNILGLLKSFEGWYGSYKFANAVNSEYVILKKDTTITFDTLTLPLRFEMKGKRLTDQTINTELGNLACKKFLTTYSVSYLVALPPPLPAIPIQLIKFNDTSYFALGKWIVKSVIPATKFDLSYLGFGSYTLPGYAKDIKSAIVGIKDSPSQITKTRKDAYSLNQNYPNPVFANSLNGSSTTIKFNLPNEVRVKLNLYDILGNEIAILVNGVLSAGVYQILIDSKTMANLSSGIYFYKLEAGSFSETKKLIYQK